MPGIVALFALTSARPLIHAVLTSAKLKVTHKPAFQNVKRCYQIIKMSEKPA